MHSELGFRVSLLYYVEFDSEDSTKRWNNNESGEDTVCTFRLQSYQDG